MASRMNSKIHRYNIAIALRYGREDIAGGSAPRVVVSSEGALADETVILARRFGVPIVEEAQVARALRAVPREGVIPPALYEAVALILDKLEYIAPSSASTRAPLRRCCSARSRGTSF